MAKFGVHRIFLLVIPLMKFVEGTKLLADFKKCGDLECETLISRVIAIKDFRGPDCRYLNFTTGEEISVYVKLVGEGEELWAGSKEKDFGYFPRDAVYIEEVFISEEVKISTKESDFLCLFGENYIFENEDSELNSDVGGNINSYEEDKEQKPRKSRVYENDFHAEHGFYSTSESTWFEDQFSASEAPETLVSIRESEANEGAESQNVKQTPDSEVSHAPLSSATPDGQGWFGFGGEEAEGQTLESVTATLQESSFQSREIAVEDENDLEELNSSESQTEYKQEPEYELDSLPRKECELMTEAENIPRTQPTGWFGGGFTNYLGLGGEETEPELQSQESSPPLQDVPSSSDEEPITPCTEILTEKEDVISNENSSLKPSWFDFGFGMLGFTYANADISLSGDGEMKERGEGDGHEHIPRESDPDKERETKVIKDMENEDQIDKETVSEKIDDSDTLQYLQKFLHNFNNPWNFQDTPKETDLSFPEHILDETHVVEDEEFLAEDYPEDDIKAMISKGSYSQSDTGSKVLIQSPKEIQDFKNPSKNYEKSKTLLDTAESAQVRVEESMENTFLDSLVFSTDESLSSPNGLAQKEDASEYQSLRYLFQIFVYDFMDAALSSVVVLTERVIAGARCPYYTAPSLLDRTERN